MERDGDTDWRFFPPGILVHPFRFTIYTCIAVVKVVFGQCFVDFGPTRVSYVFWTKLRASNNI
jgi:hypothetical protein